MIITERLGQGEHRILDLGVGGGSHLSHFSRKYKTTAIDISEKMLEVAKRLNATTKFQVADMRSVKLDEEFDVVLLHDSVSYMTSEIDLTAAFRTAFSHLRDGGLLLTAPDYVKETYTDSLVEHHTASDDKTKLAYFEYKYDLDPMDSIYQVLMLYIIRENKKLRIEQDNHTLGLFPLATWQGQLRASGFNLTTMPYDELLAGRDGYLFVGKKER